MICVFSKWIKELLDKSGIAVKDKIITKSIVIYLYEDNKLARKTIRDYLCI